MNDTIENKKVEPTEGGNTMIEVQQTLASEIGYTGKGLHSGLTVVMTLKPAPVDTGIVFIRTDMEGKPTIKACIANVTNTMRATTLEENGAKVFTVEHLLASLFAMKIDNCYIEMDSPEPPVADGGAIEFVHMIRKAGIKEQEKPRHILQLDKQYIIEEGDKFVSILPYDGFRITFTSINPHPLLGVQHGDFEITPEVFEKEIAKARTIGFLHELEMLKSMGLAKGGTVENAIVYDETSCLSTLHYEDELVRHKILDVIGDLSLLGMAVRGHVIAVKSSHNLNTKLAKKIISDLPEEVI